MIETTKKLSHREHRGHRESVFSFWWLVFGTRQRVSLHPQPSTLNRVNRGISLLEVLISMFILLFGLMGVAAMFPAGQTHVARAKRYDQAATVGQAAMNDLQVRGFLDTSKWTPGPPTPPSPIRVVIGQGATITGLNSTTVAGVPASTFQARDDLAVEFPEDADQAAVLVRNTTTNAPEYQGQYTWMATVVQEGGAGSPLRVAVAVFEGRDTDKEPPTTTAPTVSSPSMGLGGGGITLTGADESTTKPGNWVLLSHSTDGQYLWYRILARDGNTLALTGPDWTNSNQPDQANVFDSVVAVYEQTIPEGGNSAWD